MRKAMVVAVVVLVAAGCGAKGGSSSDSHTITGTMTLTDPSGFDYDEATGVDKYSDNPAEACRGIDGYDDMAAGAPVVVKSDQETVADGSLRAGRLEGDECTFSFTVRDVPSRKFYTVEVSHPRNAHVLAGRDGTPPLEGVTHPGLTRNPADALVRMTRRSVPPPRSIFGQPDRRVLRGRP